MATITPQITTDPTIMAQNRAKLVADINDSNGTTAQMGGGKVSDVGGNVVATPPTGNVITSDILKSNPTPVTLPTITASPTPKTPIVTPPSGTIADQKTGFVSIIPTQKTEQQKYLESLGVPQALETLKTRGAVTAQLQDEAKLTQKSEQAVKDYNTYLTAKQNLQQELEQIRAKSGGLVSGTNEEYNSALRRGNADLANLAIKSQLSQGLYDSARQTIKDKLDAQFQPLQDQIDYAFKAAQIYNNDPEIKAMAKRKETDYNNLFKTSEALHQAVLDNGNPPGVLAAMDKAIEDYRLGKTTADVAINNLYNAVGRYGGNIKEQALKTIQIENAKLQGDELRQKIKAGKPYTGEYASIVNGAAGLVANTKKEQVKLNIGNALSSGNFINAYSEIANAVSDGLTGTPKTKFDDARTDIGIMQGLKTVIQNYANAGGDMGLLTGTEEEIKRKLGIDSGKASALATQLWREFQTYRSNMTGAAFTPQESRDYAAVNPTLGKSLNLNLNVIDGALNQLNNRIESTINARIPDAKKIKDLINNKDPLGLGVTANNNQTNNPLGI